MQKIGIGYDIHKLVEGRKLVLGGLDIPFKKGLEGHSDADVVIHAICDALLGATGLGDIGEHFPDTDEEYKDIDSAKLLKLVKALADEKNLSVSNIDAIVIADEPNLKPFKPKMRTQLAEILNVSEELVNIKAKTQEGLGPEAIAAYAVVLLTD
ncbi:MAG: 2-C-methyl-D-erythritol 2,4-cyclodiphosphate synthase [Candidatus Aceula meridiana]|nr:2-C-methyl-D-erythritol 2,4-cyclodiphosphate synthase [Candidatus Aceula meridiana]